MNEIQKIIKKELGTDLKWSLTQMEELKLLICLPYNNLYITRNGEVEYMRFADTTLKLSIAEAKKLIKKNLTLSNFK